MMTTMIIAAVCGALGALTGGLIGIVIRLASGAAAPQDEDAVLNQMADERLKWEQGLPSGQ